MCSAKVISLPTSGTSKPTLPPSVNTPTKGVLLARKNGVLTVTGTLLIGNGRGSGLSATQFYTLMQNTWQSLTTRPANDSAMK